MSYISPFRSRPIQQLYPRHRDCTSLLDSLAAVSTFLLSCLPCASSLFAPHPGQSRQFLILGCKIAQLLSDHSSKSSLTMSQELSYSDVSSHSTKKDLYVVIHDKIYNASSFVDEHPLGAPILPHSRHSVPTWGRTQLHFTSRRFVYFPTLPSLASLPLQLVSATLANSFSSF